jgi:hypothetical protein
MASEKKLDPMMAEKLKQAAAAAKEDVLSRSAMDALLNATPEELISASPDPEVIKGNMNRPSCWIEGPAMVEFNAASDRRLTRVAGWDGINTKKVGRVHADLVPGTMLLVIRAALPTDLSAIQVNRYASATKFNLVDLLADQGLQVETNYRERYEVAYIPKASKLWPGLVIDLSQPKERRITSTKKAEAQTAAQQQPNPQTQQPAKPEGAK